MSVKIVFHGLLVFHKMNNHMEIGVLNGLRHHGGGGGHPHGAPAHIPRIIKTKNGVIHSTYDLRNRSELGPVRNWEIFVSHPLQGTAVTVEHNGPFVRATHPDTRDFRWIADLEGDDLYNRDLTGDLESESDRIKNLLLVLKVQNGVFYTEQLSKPLKKKTLPAGPQVDYGMAAEVIGCDIPINRGTVELKVDDDVVFTFDGSVEDGVVYEFSNAPPDVLEDEPYPLDSEGHFSMYRQKLFKNPDQPGGFNLIPGEDVDPAPDPALCGASGLGKRPGGI